MADYNNKLSVSKNIENLIVFVELKDLKLILKELLHINH